MPSDAKLESGEHGIIRPFASLFLVFLVVLQHLSTAALEWIPFALTLPLCFRWRKVDMVSENDVKMLSELQLR